MRKILATMLAVCLLAGGCAAAEEHAVTLEQTEDGLSTTGVGSYIEEPILLRPGAADETAGSLTLPAGDGPFPVLIFVHGSGSSDMDEAALGNAPFRDLAHGLAARGVGSIRYDKYTYAHPELVGANFTVGDEYARDVRDAAHILLSDGRVGDIYVLGHSMGAMLAPRLMKTLEPELGNRLAGAVLLAGTPLHLWEVQYRQNLDVIATLSGEQKAAAEELVAAEVDKLDALTGMSPEDLESATFFGIPAHYQLDEMSVDAAETATALALPLFVAQGAKDWQVRPADGIELWRARLPEGLASFHLYENMNHMLSDLEGEPTGTLADYAQEGAHVSEQLIEDISAWIAQR